MLENSLAWDHRHSLPLCPQFSNPHLYAAYCIKLTGRSDELLHRYKHYLWLCERGPGLYTRWPDRSGGFTSHDELIGIAYLNREAADQILDALNRSDGEYNPLDLPERPGEWNLNRFLFLKPYLRARSVTYSLNAFSQALWAATTIVPDLWTPYEKLSAGSLLRNWLMCEEMEKFPISGAAVRVWKARMKKMKVGPRWCLSRYLSEIPELRELAPEEF